MSELKHTLGPWSTSKNGDAVYGRAHRHPQSTELGVEMQSEPIVCFVRGYSGSQEAEANARLIAAAPELLEALLYYRDEAISSHPAEFVHVDRARKFEQLAEAAIAKAEGK